jgi:dCTP deaminase
MSSLQASRYLSLPNFCGLLPDVFLKELDDKLPEERKLISPFVGKLVSEEDGKKIISYGLSSYGYDIRVAPDFKLYSNINHVVNDPKNVSNKHFADVVGEEVIIPPNSYVLCRSLEKFDLPTDITGIAMGKSTYARTGLVCNITPLEAGWCGYLTIEIANCSPLPAKIYANEGIAQILFQKSFPCEVSYSDRKGKYQDQPAQVVLPKV